MAHKWNQIYPHNMDKVDYIVGLLLVQKMHAVDVSEEMLAIAASKFSEPGIEYIHADVLTLGIGHNYDIITCYSMFPHFKDQKLVAVQKLAKMLKGQGKLCIAHSQSRADINALHQKAGDPVKEDRLPPMEVLVKAFEKNELRVTTCVDNADYYIIIGERNL